MNNIQEDDWSDDSWSRHSGMSSAKISKEQNILTEDRDAVFRELHPEISEFTFDKRVTSVFGDMLKRSVPGYGTLLSLISVFAKKYAQPHSRIYDIGCAIGGSSLAIANNLSVEGCEIHAYDTSKPMIEKFNWLLENYSLPTPIHTFCEDVLNVEFENSSIIIINLTLQFINPEDREPLLRKLYNSLNSGGVLILAEKISDTSDNELFTEIYYDFKRANDYSNMEISQKRSALENVLITDTEEIHINRLKEIGFARVERWFQTLNFRAYAAWKE